MSVKVSTRDEEDTIEIELSTVPFSVNKIARWGWMDTSNMLVEAQIVVLQGSGEFPSGSKVIADYRPGNGQPMFLYMAERDTEPIKTVWYGSGINQGLIGPGEAFQVIGIVNGWRVYRSNFKTQFTTTTEFRVS